MDASWQRTTPAPPLYSPLRLIALALLSMTTCALLIAATVVVARQQPPPPGRRALSGWATACGLAITPTAGSLKAGASHQGAVPGAGPYRAQSELAAEGAIQLADLVLALGQPESACLDYGLQHGKAVVWLRLVLSDGKIEALARLPPQAKRVQPDAPIQAVYCYASPDETLLRQAVPWRGFTAVDAYPGCRYSGTAAPP